MKILLSLSLIAITCIGSIPLYAADETMDEVVVTGSYIKRDNFDLASPVNIVDAVDIEEAGTPNLADVLWEQTFMTGTQTIATPHNANIGGQGGESAQAAVGFGNIRGLGPDATLNLMDGKRLPFGDANFNYPQIAIQRIETLLDGASALYGTEAIAGVINYIPRKNFEGFKVRYERREFMEVSAPDQKVALLFGAQGERARGMFALEYRWKDRVEQHNYPRYKAGCNDNLLDPGNGNCFDTAIRDRVPRNGFPGGALRTIRDATGQLVTTPSGDLSTIKRPSPGCGHDFAVPRNADGDPIQAANPLFGGIGRGNDNPTVKYANRWGIPHPNGRDCGMSMSYLLDYQGEIPGFLHGYTRFEFDITDNVTAWTDLMFGRRQFNTRAWPSPHPAQTEPLTVPGDHPGNPNRAFADTNENGIYEPDAGDRLLYAQDNCNFNDCTGGDGLPDRGVDRDGDGVPDDIDGDGSPDPVPREQGQWGQPVMLADDPFNPDAGIAFNNDVTLNRWTPFTYGHLQGLPDYVESGGWALRDREERNMRVGGGLEMSIPNTTWDADLSFVWGERQQDYAFAWGSTYNSTFGNVLERINCVRNDNEETPRGVESDCVPFNPFVTSQFPVENYVPQNRITPEFIPDPDNPGEEIRNPAFNTDEMVEGIMSKNNDLQTNNITLVDFVAQGAPYELPWSWSGGRIGVALGAQLRIEEEEFLPNHMNESGTNIWGTGFPRRESEEQGVDFFGEMILPLMQHSRFGYLELQLAGRHTDVEYDADIGNTAVSPNFSEFVPKYALLYQPNDWLSFRASYSEGFVTPQQEQVVGTTREADRTAQDPTCDVLENLDIILDAANGFPDSGCTYDVVNGVSQVTGEELVDVVGSNPNLGPQTSEATSLGVSFRLLDGDLALDFNYIDIEFLGEIRDIVIRDRLPIEQDKFNRTLINECGSDPSATCAASFRETYISTLETDRFERDGTFGPITRHVGGPENTTGRFVTAYDMQARYRFGADQIPFVGGNWGTFQARLNATYNDKFEYHIGADSPRRDGAGFRNDCCGRQPIPELRLNGSLRYMYGNHTARLSFTWHDEVKDLDATGAIPFSNKRGKIDSQAVFSLYYQYNLDVLPNFSPTMLSLSVYNLFDDRPKPLVDSSGMDPILSGKSPLGRILTLRVEQSL